MRKLHEHKKNPAVLLLAVCELRALPSNGFACHIMFDFSTDLRTVRVLKIESINSLLMT
jgi:hypothetical protein